MEEGVLTWEEYEALELNRENCFRCNESIVGYSVYLGNDGEPYCHKFCYRTRIVEDAAPVMLDACRGVLDSLKANGEQSRAFASEIRSLEHAINLAENDQHALPDEN